MRLAIFAIILFQVLSLSEGDQAAAAKVSIEASLKTPPITTAVKLTNVYIKIRANLQQSQQRQPKSQLRSKSSEAEILSSKLK